MLPKIDQKTKYLDSSDSGYRQVMDDNIDNKSEYIPIIIIYVEPKLQNKILVKQQVSPRSGINIKLFLDYMTIRLIFLFLDNQ